ncbi:MAG: SET domain-containing protein [Candidatus Saccharimonadales bacterium]
MQQVPKDSWFSPSIEIRTSPISGKGIFAIAPIKKGEVVEIWGEYWNGKKTVEYTDSKVKAETAKKQSKLVMYWDTNLYSIEERGADDGYYINHSCDSNLWLKDSFTLIARRDIKPGEEITIDYALFESSGDFISVYAATWDCHCGFIDCRHKITGKDWQLKAVQKMYKGHFSPLLNKKIARQA